MNKVDKIINEDIDNINTKLNKVTEEYPIADYIVEQGLLPSSTSGVSYAYYEKFSNGIIKVYAKVYCPVLESKRSATGTLNFDDFGIIKNSLINCVVSGNVDVNEAYHESISGNYVYRPSEPWRVTACLFATNNETLVKEYYYADMQVIARWKEEEV